MLDGRWLYVAALAIAAAILGRRGASARTIIELVALGHVVVLANVALFPIPIDPALLLDARTAASSGGGGLNLVPFATIGPVLTGHAPPLAARIAVLNLFVLTPAGVYLPALFESLRSWRGLAIVAIAGGVSVEAAQLAISTVFGFPYRTIDIDDVILNALGIAIGWLILGLATATRASADESWRGFGRGRPGKRRCMRG